jgi:hypothetical protein
VTWSYSNNYVGWAPLPPTVVFGASGYSGSAIVVRETQYVFVPTNRFVGGNVMSVRVPAQQSAAIFKQTRPVTGFAVSGGIVRNTALPMATIERASGRTIETKSIQTARTAPHPVAAGPAQWSVVAPAREVKAAVAARPQAAVAHNAPADHANGNANPPKAQKAPDASPIEAHRPPAEAPAAHRPESPQQADPPRPAESSTKPMKKPKPQPVDEKPDAQAHRAPAEPPPARHAAPAQPAEPNRPQADAKSKPHSDVEKPAGESDRAPAEAPVAHRPPPRPAEPGQKAKANPPKEKPVEKDQKPDGEKP